MPYSRHDSVVFTTQAQNNLGVTLYAMRRLDEAEAAFRDAARLAPDDSTLFARLGEVGRAIGSRGSLGRAVRAFGEAVRLAPADADLRASLLEARRAYSHAQS
mmetsp:Transcript_23901/g.75733  ORF Transcript_23901/g.75733 Transcript_23901/m.75733 type:complete len:103 (+) Transcript_23901:39-347(+)